MRSMLGSPGGLRGAGVGGAPGGVGRGDGGQGISLPIVSVFIFFGTNRGSEGERHRNPGCPAWLVCGSSPAPSPCPAQSLRWASLWSVLQPSQPLQSRLERVRISSPAGACAVNSEMCSCHSSRDACARNGPCTQR